jgi:phosphatidylglycerol:prolipoprotein diacylglycerol transferase
MIPYFQFTTFNLGPVVIQVWGLFVAIGILFGAYVATQMAKKRGLDDVLIWDMVFWVIIAAFVGARIIHVIYEPAYYIASPMEIFKIWKGGLSIMGGFLGAGICGVLYLRKKQVDVYKYVDTAVFGLPLGLFVGRIGCFFIHDHPGIMTDFVGGVQYVDGTRHDHGLYLSLNGLCLFLFFLYLAKKKVGTGVYLITFLIWYGIVRFALDFLRANDGGIVDIRYFDLTPAQYLSAVMFGLGIFLWVNFNKLSKKN